MATKTKERGIFLTLVLLVVAVFALVQLHFALYPSLYPTIYRGVPVWYKGYILLDFIVTAIIVVGLWNWKKWAIYCLIGLLIFEMFVDIFLSSKEVSATNFLLTILFSAVTLWSIYRKKANFR